MSRGWHFRFKLIGIVALAFTVSIGWVVYALYTRQYLEGGRGGAVAVAGALSVLFVTRGYAIEIFRAWIDSAIAAANLDELEETLAPGDGPLPRAKPGGRSEGSRCDQSIENRIRGTTG